MNHIKWNETSKQAKNAFIHQRRRQLLTIFIGPSKICLYSLEKMTFVTIYIRPNKVRRTCVDFPIQHLYIEGLSGK